MASKPELIHSNTSPQGPLSAGPQTPPAKALPPYTPPVLVDKVQPKTHRPRTHTWPLPKADQALVAASAGPCPTSPESPASPPKAPEARAELPKLNLQVMLDQLDRDMADCPYYEVYSF